MKIQSSVSVLYQIHVYYFIIVLYSDAFHFILVFPFLCAGRSGVYAVSPEGSARGAPMEISRWFSDLLNDTYA